MTWNPGAPTRMLASLAVWAFLALPALAGVKLPPAVASAFHKAYPKASIKNTMQELRDGKTVYEIESIDRGMLRDLLYTVDGHVLECEETVPVDSLPEAVRVALKREAPGAKVIRAEHIDREGVESFSIQVKAKGTLRELNFDRQGKTLAP